MSINHPSTSNNNNNNTQNTSNEKFIPTYEFSGFEGPEKKLEIKFQALPENIVVKQNINLAKKKATLRSINKLTWDKVLEYAKCEIISKTSNKYFDSYVLSESSLFVFDNRIMIKTCGTTTLLYALEPILKVAKEQFFEPVFVYYSRKNFVFPKRQVGPHLSWKKEIAYLNKYFEGREFIFGNPKKDHWNLYVADYQDSDSDTDTDVYNNNKLVVSNNNNNLKEYQTIEILMHDLCPKKMKQFFKTKEFKNVEDVTVSSGIQNILPGSKIDAFQFDPCGYSMNGLLNNSYSTIHITPEKDCSYVSYETNISLTALNKLGIKNYGELVKRVTDVFSPGRALVILFADDNSFVEGEYLSCDVLDCKKALNSEKKSWYKSSKEFCDLENYNLTFESITKKK